MFQKRSRPVTLVLSCPESPCVTWRDVQSLFCTGGRANRPFNVIAVLAKNGCQLHEHHSTERPEVDMAFDWRPIIRFRIHVHLPNVAVLSILQNQAFVSSVSGKKVNRERIVKRVCVAERPPRFVANVPDIMRSGSTICRTDVNSNCDSSVIPCQGDDVCIQIDV